MHKIFLTLLKGGPQIKNRLLTWIGRCLKANGVRGKLWNIQVSTLGKFLCAYIHNYNLLANTPKLFGGAMFLLLQLACIIEIDVWNEIL